jgi:hypothetical protein
MIKTNWKKVFNLPVLGMITDAGVVVAEIMVISFVVTGSAAFCVVEEVFCGVDVDG